MTELLTDKAEALASALARSRTGGPKTGLSVEHSGPLSAGQAYQAQEALAQRFGPVGAFKVACKPGQPVIMAPIYAADIRPSGHSFPTPKGEQIGIELEIGFRILRPLPQPSTAEYRQRLRDCVSLVPVIEVVLTRLEDAEAASPMLRLADNQLNGGLVVGPERADWQDLNLTQATATLDFGGTRVLDGTVPVPGGDAFESFCKLAEMTGSHCGGLQPGHVAITGSLNGLPYIDAGTTVKGCIEGLGEVSVSFP
ncbi:2-keto-4-pentenoate hydratase [Leisingera daeponensis]|uniref:2-keto-4-pentenoate hydratase n=1 Tax=Leisingera daeponensis TaxID=405746 RepID=A0ABS7NLY1_9RHOB|nr:fumarylacetoacetate hydrolase family protein [Leisingera daeponensis]MBY6142200.1 2-keto-4-pentenoate hydratase [Leisingera daeponensis]